MGNTEGQANWRWQPPRTRPSVLGCLEGSTPSPSAFVIFIGIWFLEFGISN